MKTWIIRIVIVSACLLIGCQERNLTSNLENIELDNEQVIDVDTNPLDDLDNEQLNEQPIRPAVVSLIDPRTLEIIQTIIPEQLGFGTNDEAYQTTIKGIAKQLARGTENFSGYDQSMFLDKVDEKGQIIKGNPGLILKESELVDQIIAASKNGDNVYLPLYLLETSYKVEDVPSLNDVTVATFTTYFDSSDIGRSKNIELSANAINNIIVGNGDYFSFNMMVGERTEARGYQPALEIISKKLVIGIGGGICQTSSTLFNAVDQLGIRMTERHHHSLNVGYVPTGRDATVSYGTLDFKFQNTSGAPFLIRTFYNKNILTIEIRTAQQYKGILETI